MNYVLGFSTGIFRDKLTPKQSLHMTKKLGCKAVELGYIRYERLSDGSVDELEASDFEDFEFVSVHAPKIDYGYNKETEFTLRQLHKIHKLRPLDVVVIHPNLVSNFEALKDTGLPIAFENMDNRNNSFTTPEELDELTKIHGFDKFVLDLNHIFTHDPTMKLSNKFYDVLGDRIIEIQVSGYTKEFLHDPFFKTHQKEILKAVKDYSIPIINEGGKYNPSKAKSELDYMFKNLR